MSSDELELHRHTNKVNGVVVEGRYEKQTWPSGRPYWVLRFWRITSTWQGRTTVGDWHKIHGNQRKDIGVLKLLRDNPPKID